MKKGILVFAIAALMVGCTKEDIVPTPQSVSEELKMQSSVGIKLQTVFVTSEVAMNVKTETAGSVTIKIFDIANRVVSKETMNVVAGDNVLKVYTSALPSSAYRIGLFDANGKQLGITDFNKL
jgi:TRAP-type mannitol/chloroaromatic compound transport system substrate-binding protein